MLLVINRVIRIVVVNFNLVVILVIRPDYRKTDLQQDSWEQVVINVESKIGGIYYTQKFWRQFKFL